MPRKHTSICIFLLAFAAVAQYQLALTLVHEALYDL
jgi:hypothetical protein